MLRFFYREERSVDLMTEASKESSCTSSLLRIGLACPLAGA